MSAGGSDSEITSAIGKPATRALRVTGITTYKQLATFSERRLLEIHGVGPKAVGILREELSKRDLTFSDV